MVKMDGELPDLNKQNVGWIAYYNVIDNTDVTQSDLTDGTTEGSDGPAELESMISDRDNENIEYRDNGVIVKYLGPTRLVTIRFKTDGWITAHMDRQSTRTDFQNNYDGLNGVADIVRWNDDVEWDNSTDASESSLVKNSLERSIKTALEQMGVYSSKISGSYDPNDVNLYNYRFQTNNVTLLSDAKIGNEGSFTYEFQYTEATEVQHVSVATAMAGDSGSVVDIEQGGIGNIVSPDNSEEWAMYDVTSEFNSLSSGEPFVIKTQLDNDGSYREYSLHVVVVWN